MDNAGQEFDDLEFTPTVDEAAQTTATQSSTTSRSWIELLLDPQTLQGLMCCGAGLLVLGLVVWLWSIGIFENKLIVAVCLGTANVGLLAGGVASVCYSRYQTAGKAITMLSCLVMPLNLWFYDAQGLITLDQNGHLWVPALVCCALYLLVARLLADPIYVNAIVGGVTMTGLLFLADSQVDRLWEVMAPSTFLVVLGMICIHIERAFPPEQGPFSRDNFGRAFFHAGHFVMGLGLMVLLTGRIVGWLYTPLLANYDWCSMPAVATQSNLKLLALVLALSAAYSYVYSQVVVQSKGRYLASAVLTLLWSTVILLDLLQVEFTTELFMLLAAGGAVLINLALPATKPQVDTDTNSKNLFSTLVEPLQQTGSSLALGLNITTFGLGVLLYCRARIGGFFAPYDFGWMFILAALLGSVACLLTVRRQALVNNHSNFAFQLAVVATWFAIDASIALFGVELTAWTLAVQMLVPLGFAVVALMVSDANKRHDSASAAEVLATLLLMVNVGGLLGILRAPHFAPTHFWQMLFFAESAICLGLATQTTARTVPAILAAMSICGATWQMLLLLGVTQYGFLLATTCVGMICLTIPFFAAQTDEKPSQFSNICQWAGRACISYGNVAALLIALARLLAGETQWSLFALLLAQVVAGVLAGVMSRQTIWRRHFWVLAITQTLMTLLVVNSLSSLSFLQRGELLLTTIGLIALAVGYWGWSKETEQPEDLVSFNLAFGSLFSATPLTLGMLIQRFDNVTADWGWVMIHEIGVLIIGLVLLGAGVLCRIRWSTIVGGSTLLVYIMSLIGLIQLPEQLQSTAIYMMVGGGFFFATAVLLSVYRDRILAIPKRAQEGEGVFRVLKWR